MPRLLHNQLAASVAEDLRWQLQSIASGTSPAAIFAQKTRNTVSATIEFPGSPRPKHSPDGSIKHIKAKYCRGIRVSRKASCGTERAEDKERLGERVVVDGKGTIVLSEEVGG